MKKVFFVLTFLFFSLALLKVPLFAADGEKSVISIDHAQKVENSKDSVSGDDCIVLTGNVKISVSRGSSKTEITAEKINYNRSTEMIYAEGSVALKQSGGSAGGESITASSLLFNTSTMEGVFDDGRAVQTSSDALNLPSGSTLIVASDVFGRDSEGTIAFKSGELTFCDDENPHWRIKARRIWLLPGGEFAFLSATLFIGYVPLLYLPAFYYPKDELVFNPAFGFRNREGYYINTTTYLYGRKPSDAKSSAEIRQTANASSSSSSSSSSEDNTINFFSFMNTGTMKEQRLEGLVLHNLEENYKGDTSKYFKIMGDYYANLGTMVGFDGSFAPGSVLTSLQTNMELGFSRTIFRNESIYVSHNTQGDVVTDSSNFIGVKMPFRYQANLKFTIAKPFNWTFSMPVYSDPYFNYDFNTRAETMDWIDYAMNNTSTTSTTSEVTQTEISSFTWDSSGSYTPSLPDGLKPYISSLSLSSFSSSIVYSSKAHESLSEDDRYTADSSWGTYTPERKFFYPSQITPFKASGKISGNIIEIPYTKKTSSSKKNSDIAKLTPPKEFEGIDLSKKEEDSEEKDGEEKTEDKNGEKTEEKSEGKEGEENREKETEEKKEEKTENKEDEEDDAIFSDKYLPLLTAPSFTTTEVKGISYSLGYSVSPDFTSQFSYSSVILKTPDDFDWKDMQSTYIQVKAPTSLTSKIGYRDSFLTLTDTFTFNPIYQTHPYLKMASKDENGKESTANGGYTESSAKSIEKADYTARKLDVTDVNALTFKPFYYTKHFSETSLTWNTTIKMIRTEFVGDADNPEWEYRTPDIWDDECFTVHNLNLVLGASQFDKKVYQTLSLTSTLPPQVDEYKGTLTLGFPYLSGTAGTGIKKKSADDDEWVKENFVQSSTLKMFDSKLSFTQSFTYNLEDEHEESLKFSLSGYGLTAAYTASYVYGYTFTESSGWKQDSSEKVFQPYQFSLSYSSPSKTFKRWNDRISTAPGLSTSIVYDCLKPTASYFKFAPSLTFKINSFLDIKVTAESSNKVIYRYFCSDDDYQTYYQGGGERNILQDLINSFRFDDESKRIASAFKIESLKIDVTHDLDDWDLNCSFSIKPRLMTSSVTGYDASRGTKYYDFSPYFTISVAWRPLSSMKTQIVDEYGEWKLNP